jgi:26S proteasome non-ATPase regulatory subunit 9
MQNLHAPTIPSGPTTSNGGGIRTEGLTLPELQLKKESMEAELRALGGVLESVSPKMSYVKQLSRQLMIPSMELI